MSRACRGPCHESRTSSGSLGCTRVALRRSRCGAGPAGMGIGGRSGVSGGGTGLLNVRGNLAVSVA